MRDAFIFMRASKGLTEHFILGCTDYFECKNCNEIFSLNAKNDCYQRKMILRGKIASVHLEL